MAHFVSMKKCIGIIGDYKPENQSHRATNDAVRHSAATTGLDVDARWLGTEEMTDPDGPERLRQFGGLWIAPASPYKSMAGALLAIRTAREQRIPLLGTCGGFQHIILEYARNVLGIADAEHEETSPGASRLFISRLKCSLAGRTMTITLQPESLIARLYGRTTAREEYYCNFGVNPEYLKSLFSGQLRVAGSDAEGVARAVELTGHPFFVGTLFLPQHTSSATAPHPLVTGFLKAALDAA
jgi:CTP synthase (UTP-ammonia lyase)